MTWRLCVTHKELELLTDINDFTTQFYLIMRCKFSDWLEWSIESDFGMQFAIWSLDLAIHNFAFFKHHFQCKNRSLKRVSYFLIFVFHENKIFVSVNHDPREPPVRPSKPENSGNSKQIVLKHLRRNCTHPLPWKSAFFPILKGPQTDFRVLLRKWNVTASDWHHDDIMSWPENPLVDLENLITIS